MPISPTTPTHPIIRKSTGNPSGNKIGNEPGNKIGNPTTINARPTPLSPTHGADAGGGDPTGKISGKNSGNISGNIAHHLTIARTVPTTRPHLKNSPLTPTTQCPQPARQHLRQKIGNISGNTFAARPLHSKGRGRG